MIGAIIGDMVGSVYEFSNIRSKDFPLFSKNSCMTDDSIMSLAVLDFCENDRFSNEDCIIDKLKTWGRAYPNCGYGNMFRQWLFSDRRDSYHSYGNGAAMRVSACGWYGRDEEEVKEFSKKVTEVTHSHEEGLKGAEVTAMCIYYARKGKSKEFIREYASKYYDLNFDYEELKKNYYFNETCQNTVPQAIFCFLISNDFEDCLRTSISIGGDSDTLAAISCSIAEAYYRYIPKEILSEMWKRVPSRVGECDPQELLMQFLDRRRELFEGHREEDTKYVLIERIFMDNQKIVQELYEDDSLSVLGVKLFYEYALERILPEFNILRKWLNYYNYDDLLVCISKRLKEENITKEMIEDLLEGKDEEAFANSIQAINAFLGNGDYSPADICYPIQRFSAKYFKNKDELVDYMKKNCHKYEINLHLEKLPLSLVDLYEMRFGNHPPLLMMTSFSHPIYIKGMLNALDRGSPFTWKELNEDVEREKIQYDLIEQDVDEVGVDLHSTFQAIDMMKKTPLNFDGDEGDGPEYDIYIELMNVTGFIIGFGKKETGIVEEFAKIDDYFGPVDYVEYPYHLSKLEFGDSSVGYYKGR